MSSKKSSTAGSGCLIIALLCIGGAVALVLLSIVLRFLPLIIGLILGYLFLTETQDTTKRNKYLIWITIITILAQLIWSLLFLSGNSSDRQDSKVAKTNSRPNSVHEEVEETTVPWEEQDTYKIKSIGEDFTISIQKGGDMQEVKIAGLAYPTDIETGKLEECFKNELKGFLQEELSEEDVNITFLEKDTSTIQALIWTTESSLFSGDKYTLVNKYIIEEGYASYDKSLEGKDIERDLQDAEKTALDEESGIWGEICSCKKGKESYRNCTECKIAEVTYKNWDCSSYSETVTDTSCTARCYTCNCGKTCSQITTCHEAYYQLQTCGCTNLDRDGDGSPCEWPNCSY
jgi:hypothetical protein